MTGDPAPETGRRERAKGERRQRIIAAAHDLLREVGREALSMKMLAAHADVAVSTLYMLFDSKQAILSTVFNLDLDRFRARLDALASSDAVERLFDIVDIAADMYRADPKLQRALLWRMPGPEPEAGLDATLRQPRIDFWRGLVRGAIAEGLLKRSTDADVLAALLIHIFSGAIEDWLVNAISVERMRDETQFGFAVALVPFATRAVAPRLSARIAQFQAILATPAAVL